MTEREALARWVHAQKSFESWDIVPPDEQDYYRSLADDVLALLHRAEPTPEALAISDAHSAGFEAGVLAFASPMPSGAEITAEEGQAWGTYLAARLRLAADPTDPR